MHAPYYPTAIPILYTSHTYTAACTVIVSIFIVSFLVMTTEEGANHLTCVIIRSFMVHECLSHFQYKDGTQCQHMRNQSFFPKSPCFLILISLTKYILDMVQAAHKNEQFVSPNYSIHRQ
jgi:hypothetical protein